MTAVLSSAGTHERIAEAVAECVRLGIRVLPPDVNRSSANFELHDVDEERAIVYGLATVKNVGQGAAEGVIEARASGGPFADIEDFTKRVDLKALNRRALESLVKCGGLDALGARGTLLANLDRIVSLAQREAKLKETGQSTMFDLFGDSVATPLPSLEMTPVEVSKAELLAWEKELLGVYVSEHPFSGAATTVARHTSALVSEITAEMDGRDVVIAGMVNVVRSLTTKAGKVFCAVTVEDLSGSAEVTVWPDVFEPTRELWSPGNILLLLVRVRERGDRLQAAVQQVSLVQAADGSLSHESFEVPPWLTEAVRSSAGVAVTEVRHAPANDAPKPSAPAAVDAPPPAPPSEPPKPANGRPRATLRFVLHESEDETADRERLDALISLLADYPGHDAVRLFIHARDGDRIELTLPDARACDELRAAGIAALGPNGARRATRRAEAHRRRPAARGVAPPVGRSRFVAEEAVEDLSARQAFDAMVGLLREYGALMADSVRTNALLEAIVSASYDATRLPPDTIWSDWLTALQMAVDQPEVDRPRPIPRGESRAAWERPIGDATSVRVTALQAFDATIRLLEHLQPLYPAADHFLGEFWYSDVYGDHELNTRDPGCWWDWLVQVTAARDRQDGPDRD